MAVWQENFKRFLKQKEVIILHGNVRDTAYIKEDGTLIPGLTALIKGIGKELGFQRMVQWGVFFDGRGEGQPPMWSIERIESLEGNLPPEIETAKGQEREIVVLTRWLKNEIIRRDQKHIFVINYIDKLTPYSSRGIYPKDITRLITLIEKIIENIPPNNRLIMVALQDSMIPLDYYINSPKVTLMEIPLPDKDERLIFFTNQLGTLNIPPDRLDFLANITDGLFVRDLENIVTSIIKENDSRKELTPAVLRKIVNRYRLGTEDDPWVRLPLEDPQKGLIDSAEKWFKDRIIGQDEAVEAVVKAIKKARAGVVGLASGQETKPKAVFFFAGPTGVGKTFLAKKLAEYLFDTEEAFIRFDMSEFKEEHTVSKLIGSPPGYVGYEKGGMLTNAVRNRPFSVILFDEIEKAHPRILDIFLQILDDGRLTDSRGQTVFFTESVIIFTSNIGTRTTDSRGNPINERDKLEDILKNYKDDDDERRKKVKEHFVNCVREFFMYEISRPELLNRIGSHIIAFSYIDANEHIRKIIQAKLKDIEENFKDKFSEKNYRLKFNDNVVEYFLNKHKDHIRRFGGRGLVNAIDDEVGHILADQILNAEKYNQQNIIFTVTLDNDGRLICRRES